MTDLCWAIDSLNHARFGSLWLDTPARPRPRPPFAGPTEADLVVVGGGFTGLWTALRAVEREPGRRVVLVEADRVAEHATGRNGGFCEATLTHGEANGLQRWPEEYDELHRMGLRNLDDIAATIAREGIDCGFGRGGALAVATRPHEVAGLGPGDEGFLDGPAVRALVDSPTFLAGRWDRDGCALVDPARLAWGLADVAERAGVVIAEGTRLTDLTRTGSGIRAHLSHLDAGGHDVQSSIHARTVALATNAFPGPLRRTRSAIVPVFDYVLATEPLTPGQRAGIGWPADLGVSDSGNQFHYARPTQDGRILWGGYDAIYHYRRTMASHHFDRRATFETLARNFAEAFPTLEGVRFSHRWSGVIDTSTRFCAFYGTAYAARVAYALGFTGLGVGASRFAADVMLDLLGGEDTERTRLRMVREKPMPFPPEPLTWLGIQATRWSLAREDRTGRRNLWLRGLDRVGLGFDS